jgi:CHAD domain-containing protein
VAGGGRLLASAERAACLEIARRSDLHGRRARALLALDDGQTQEEAGRRAGMSERRVRFWLAGLRQKRLRVFPARVLGQIAALPGSSGEELLAPPSAGAAEGTATLRTSPVAEGTPAAPAAAAAATLPAPAALEPDDTMAQAGRKTLALHLRRMLQHETGVRLGQDIEAVHDMRVATRRMRAARRIFGAYLDAGQVAVLGRDLRRAGRLLGTVRDMDVFYEKAQRYLDGLAAEQRAGLDPLLAVWRARYAQARGELLAYLDGERYARFRERTVRFLQAPDPEAALHASEEPRPHRLRQVVPVALYQGLATVRAYEEWLGGQSVPLGRYHQLRIASKGLRYTLEFFRDVLGPEAVVLVDRVKALQDHLGDLQDAVVACNLLRDFLTWGTWGQPAHVDDTWPTAPVLAPGVAAYLAFRQTEIQTLVESFPPVWEQVRGPEFGRLLAQSLSVLL